MAVAVGTWPYKILEYVRDHGPYESYEALTTSLGASSKGSITCAAYNLRQKNYSSRMSDRNKAKLFDSERDDVGELIAWLCRRGSEPEIHAVSARPIATFVRGPRRHRRETL